MDNQVKKQISSALVEYMKATGLSQADIAARTDIDKGIINHIHQGRTVYGQKDTVLKDKYFSAIARYIGFKMDRTYWSLVKTIQFKKIVTSLTDAQQKAIVKTVVGQSGCGKTYTVNAYYQKNKTNSVYRIKVSNMHELRDVIYDICTELGIEPKKGKVANLRLITAKIQQLHDDGAKPLLIVDEAENLRLPVLGLFKAIYDAIIDTRLCGLVLIGTQELLDKIDKMAKKNKDGVPQFARRIKAGRVQLESIEKRYDEFIDDKTDDIALKTLLNAICDNYGELNSYLEPALIEADEMGMPLTESLFREMYDMPAIHI